MPPVREADLDDLIKKRAKGDAGYAIAYALLRLAEAQEATAVHLKYLGVGDAASTMGAVEFLATKVGEVAQSLSEVAGQVEKLAD
jgi:hypothetical protein